MDFTREPIIETIITPREGFKLVVRNSKGLSEEEYNVDAVEIVSFNNALFFRSQERPKCFLLPVSDYEVIELRETRAVLKTPLPEKAIKIGGGKERPKEEAEVESSSAESESGHEKRRGRKGSRKRKEERRKMAERGPQMNEERKDLEEKRPPSPISRLLPPPPGLISESLAKHKSSLPEEKHPSSELEDVPLPQGVTPEESEAETEHPAIPAHGHAHHESHDDEEAEFENIPSESATESQEDPQVSKKDQEEDEPNLDDEGEGKTISRNSLPRSGLGDDYLMF